MVFVTLLRPPCARHVINHNLNDSKTPNSSSKPGITKTESTTEPLLSLGSASFTPPTTTKRRSDQITWIQARRHLARCYWSRSLRWLWYSVLLSLRNPVSKTTSPSSNCSLLSLPSLTSTVSHCHFCLFRFQL